MRHGHLLLKPNRSDRVFTPKFTCRRHPYQCFRSVSQLLHPLVNQVRGDEKVPYEKVGRHLQHLAQSLEGVPQSLQHEGPLHKKDIQMVSAYASDASVNELFHRTMGGELAAPMHPFTSAMWDPALMERYTAEVLSQRASFLSVTKSGNRPERCEAGRISRIIFGHCDSARHWRELINEYCSFLPDRSLLHELENLPQEIAIGEILMEAAASARSPTIKYLVDVGGGNGMLTAQAGERLQCDSMVVDPRYPGHSIDCCPSATADAVDRHLPRRSRRHAVSRRVAFFRDTVWTNDIAAAPHETALIAKHLCGSAVDEVLTHLHNQGTLPKVLVLAPCCFNKIRLGTYCNPEFFSRTVGITTQAALDRISRLTDWNMSCYDYAKKSKGFSEFCEGNNEETHRSSPLYRNDFRIVAGSITSMQALSQLAEALGNRGRVEWLQKHGYTVRLVQYVPSCVTPKNKLIVAVQR